MLGAPSGGDPDQPPASFEVAFAPVEDPSALTVVRVTACTTLRSKGVQALQAALELDTPSAARSARLFEDAEQQMRVMPAQLSDPAAVQALLQRTDDDVPLVRNINHHWTRDHKTFDDLTQTLKNTTTG